VLDADSGLQDVAAFYGLELPPELPQATIADYLHGVFRSRPVVGDRLKLRIDPSQSSSEQLRVGSVVIGGTEPVADRPVGQ